MRDGEVGSHRQDVHRRAAWELKRCPLCGAINALSNEDCFVCSWHGAFDTNPEAVEEGLDELLTQCPELFDAMSEPPACSLGLWGRVKRFFRRVCETLCAFEENPNPGTC